MKFLKHELPEKKPRTVFIPKADAQAVTLDELPDFLKHIGLADGLDIKIQFAHGGMKVEVLMKNNGN